MPRDAQDPLSTIPLAQRLGLRWRMWRAWREGIASRNAGILRVLRAEAVGSVLIGVHHVRHQRTSVAELKFAGGASICVTDCHPPTVVSLQSRAAREHLTLAKVAHHGPCWGFYFTTKDGHFALLADDARLMQTDGRGGMRRDLVTV